MEIALARLLERSADKVQAVLNILLESPYFYAQDDHVLFLFMKRHRQEFSDFFERFYGMDLLMDSKCARVYKTKWYNRELPESARSMFNFTRRDECLAFMMLLEFFEHRLEEDGMTVEDKENIRFRFGDLLHHVHRRFLEIYPDKVDQYREDSVRSKILKLIMPKLEQFRFLKSIKPPDDIKASGNELIFEALPALYHYNGTALSRILPELQQQQNQ